MAKASEMDRGDALELAYMAVMHEWNPDRKTAHNFITDWSLRRDFSYADKLETLSMIYFDNVLESDEIVFRSKGLGKNNKAAKVAAKYCKTLRDLGYEDKKIDDEKEFYTRDEDDIKSDEIIKEDDANKALNFAEGVINVASDMDRKTHKQFLSDWNSDISFGDKVDVLDLIYLDKVERNPAMVMHTIANGHLQQSKSFEIASKYCETVNCYKNVLEFDDKKIDPAMRNEWDTYKQSVLAADERKFERGKHEMVMTLHGMSRSIELINEYENIKDDPAKVKDFVQHFDGGDFFSFARYCPEGVEVMRENLTKKQLEGENGFGMHLDAIEQQKETNRQAAKTSTTQSNNPKDLDHMSR